MISSNNLNQDLKEAIFFMSWRGSEPLQSLCWKCHDKIIAWGLGKHQPWNERNTNTRLMQWVMVMLVVTRVTPQTQKGNIPKYETAWPACVTAYSFPQTTSHFTPSIWHCAQQFGNYQMPPINLHNYIPTLGSISSPTLF